MNNFTYMNPTKIIFGKGAENQVGAETAAHAKKILLHYGSGSIKKSGLYDRVCASLKAAGVQWVELGGVVPNPRLALVQQGVKLCKENKLELILAVGGGSVIDSAKAIAMGAVMDGDVWNYYIGKGQPAGALPVATVLTIPAAGSESSPGTVITNDEGMLKRAVNADCLFPRFSILNPELTFTLPRFQIACGASDIMAHLMERYFTNTKNVEYTDRLLEATMKTVSHMAAKVLDNPADYDAWSEFMWAGTVAHNNLLDTGRLADWASHDIEHELSGIYDVAHGAGLAVVFPAWMKYNLSHDVNRFAQWAARVWNVDMDYFNPEATAREGIRRLEAYYHSLGLGTRLADLDIGIDRLDEMARKSTDGDVRTIGQFVKLDSKAVRKILELAAHQHTV
ncbi:MAG: iron-containing alcohol dehydrogenase [Spirochaetia bacterium]|jgi:alcohol dehydrogenase YqhD (iron-dependent ADH family)|nr:iron-containing alcohol dehydrogenase [Spirochaetia bacterium]